MKTFQKPLTAEEETCYIQMLQDQDSGRAEEARQILIERNMRLVAHIAKKYQNADEDMEDLISIGTIGLIKAVSSYDSDKGSRLATYAARCIDNELLMLLRKKRIRKKYRSMSRLARIRKETKSAFWISWSRNRRIL